MSSLLRPNQTAELTEEKARIAAALRDRPEMVQDKASARKQMSEIDKMLDTQAPKTLTGKEKDEAAKRADSLRDKILQGMPSKEEMRQCPVGAIKKHTNWEKRNKKNLAEWKELQLRLNKDTDDVDVANFERYRPTKSTLNIHNPIVESKDFHNIENAAPALVLKDADLKLIKERAPEEVYGRLALMDREQRALVVQQFITNWSPKK
jgi:hypothetical protein